MKLYSIKDSKAQSFGAIFHCPDDSIAMRMIRSYAKRDEVMSAYPEDFDVYCVGDFNQDTGAISPKIAFVDHLKEVIKDGQAN